MQVNKYTHYNQNNNLKCKKIFVRQYFEGTSESRVLHVPCNLWSCDICRKNKIRDLKRRLKNGIRYELENIKKEKFPDLFCIKLLTLTWPGADRRSSSHCKGYHPEYTGDESPSDALDLMQKSYNKLRAAMWRDYKHKIFKVVEWQEDGYPHFHVLMVGGGISSRRVLQVIRNYWEVKYGMGFIKLQVVKKGYKAGVNYVTKYLTKFQDTAVKGYRRFSASTKDGLLKKKIDDASKGDTFWTTFEVGSVTQDLQDDFHYIPFWSALDRDYGSRSLKCLGIVDGVYSDVVPF